MDHPEVEKPKKKVHHKSSFFFEKASPHTHAHAHAFCIIENNDTHVWTHSTFESIFFYI
jgi:hypothetical protein